jgi:hypothetical protein
MENKRKKEHGIINNKIKSIVGSINIHRIKKITWSCTRHDELEDLETMP